MNTKSIASVEEQQLRPEQPAPRVERQAGSTAGLLQHTFPTGKTVTHYSSRAALEDFWRKGAQS